MGTRKKAVPAPLVTTDSPEGVKLPAARAWCAKQFKQRYKHGEHASFLAEKILQEASEKYKLADSGVEGWTSACGRAGVQYLNYGDPYAPTIYVHSSPSSASFHYSASGWAPLAK